jgi:hypothetical protein
MSRWIERLAIVAASLAIAIGVIALLSGGLLAGRDAPGVSGTDQGPGIAVRDQGNTHLRAGAPRPVYDSNPPTSGPHVPEAVVADRAQLTDDQLLEALAAGDVVYMYGTRAMAPPFSPALAASGQAVILARRPGMAGILALAWAHLLRVASPTDPALRTFAQFWLGRGAPRSSGTLANS